MPTSTDYDVGALWWMPGQADIDEFSDDALDAYAKLIVEWIGQVEHRHLWTVVKHRHRSGIEVKASTEDPSQFELGETEVRRARDVARTRSAERYVIAYVANVGQTGATTIDILPNPLGPDADGVLNIAGDSIRYTFGRRR